MSNNPNPGSPAASRARYNASLVLGCVIGLAVLGFAWKVERSKKTRDDQTPTYQSSGPSQEAQPEQTVSITTADNWKLTGDFYAPTDKPIGGAILLHQRNGTAADWHNLSIALALHGIAALAIDQRGAGRSASADPAQSGNNAPWDTASDIQASVKWMLAHVGGNGHGPNNIAISLVGASYGANNALIYGAAHSKDLSPGNIVSIVLFSPGADYHELDAITPAKQWTRPIAVIYSQDDPIAGDGPSQILDACPSHDKVPYQIDDNKHGTDLLSEDTVSKTVEFLTRTLQQ